MKSNSSEKPLIKSALQTRAPYHISWLYEPFGELFLLLLNHQVVFVFRKSLLSNHLHIYEDGNEEEWEDGNKNTQHKTQI